MVYDPETQVYKPAIIDIDENFISPDHVRTLWEIKQKKTILKPIPIVKSPLEEIYLELQDMDKQGKLALIKSEIQKVKRYRDAPSFLIIRALKMDQNVYHHLSETYLDMICDPVPPKHILAEMSLMDGLHACVRLVGAAMLLINFNKLLIAYCSV